MTSNKRLTGKGVSDDEIKTKYPYAWKQIQIKRNLPLGGENPEKLPKAYIEANRDKLLNYGKNFQDATLKYMEQRLDPVKAEEARKANEYASKHQKCPPEDQQGEQNKCEETTDEQGNTYTTWYDPTAPPTEWCNVGKASLGWKTKDECDAIRTQKWAEHEAKLDSEATGAEKFFRTINKGLMSVADAVVSLPIPGWSGVVGDLYKNFAPPGSKYFDINDRRSFGDKMKDYAVEKTIGLAEKGATEALKYGAKKLLGLGLPRDKNIIWRMAKASYADPAEQKINDWVLVQSYPTLKFYKRGNDIVIAVRGTNPTDPNDLKADGLIAIGGLPTSDRYKTDLGFIKQFQAKYPPSQFSYSGVGHSLGGAIVDELIKSRLIKDGYTYNPAVNMGDFKKAIPNHRVYMDADPLYQIMGKHTPKPEVRKYKPKNVGFFQSIASKVPGLGNAMVGLDAHKLDNFVGGIHSKFAKQLADIGLSQEQYLRHARELARRHGYDPKKVSFAENGVNKLTYKDGNRISHFGRVGYGDFIIWSWKEKQGSVPKGFAKQKQNTFHRSHSKIKGDWKSDPLSPNNLALRVLW